MNNRFSLNSQDWKRWFKNFLKYSLPSIIAAVGALQAGLDWRIALGMAISALIATLTDLANKWLAENP